MVDETIDQATKRIILNIVRFLNIKGSGQRNSSTNYLFGLLKYLLNGNHYNVDNGNIVDGPSNPFGFIEMSPGFANTEANLKVIND